ncbi:unnamed protein product [Ectocarpus sp. 12 AP-2014]
MPLTHTKRGEKRPQVVRESTAPSLSASGTLTLMCTKKKGVTCRLVLFVCTTPTDS